MKALVVYYSRTGNTKKAGEDIAKALLRLKVEQSSGKVPPSIQSCDSEEIIDRKGRKGPLGFMSAGRDAQKKKLTEIGPAQKDPARYDLVIIGTPIWGSNLSCAARTYISQNKAKLKKVAFFCTAGGGLNCSAFKDMEELCGKKPRATLELSSEEVASGGHLKKVRDFAKRLSLKQ
jgi:flavodoxin